MDRGILTEAIDVEITTETSDARILFTNGDPPSEGTLFTGPVGEVYQGPNSNRQDHYLRAAAFKPGYLPSNVDTHTYIFPEQVIRQPSNPEGFPDKWVNYPADYEMDSRVVDDPAYKDEIVTGLTSIPTMSIVMATDQLFGAQEGIYARSSDRGDASEREGSVELIHPDGSKGFQENCGIRVHGFGWRDHNNTHKHSFRLEFREIYGKTKLDYKLFADAPVERFDSIVLRSQGSKGWQDFRDPEQTQYLHDTFARDTARDMGKIDGHATYVHLYLNGLYWGLYNPVERPDADFGAEYLGGSADEYDAINRRTTTNEAIDGDLKAYDEMIAVAQKGVRTLDDYQAIESYLDIDDMIDYMLIHQYMSNRDGPEEFNSNNMRGVRKREPGAQFRFFVWDMEYSLWEVDRNININVAIPGSISFVYSRLRDFPEFRLRYADHVHRHLFNNGALTPNRVLERWNRRSDEIYSALIGESARWGDAKRPNQPFTRDVEWTEERRRLIEEYFPERTEVLVRQLKAADLYPEVQAPQFNQHGGQIASDFKLTMTAGALFNPEKGVFYYTEDGTDPRLYAVGDVAPSAIAYNKQSSGITLAQSTTINARTRRDDGTWSALAQATFILGVAPTPATLKISEIHYRPAAPSESELAAGFDKRSDFEFLELYNAGSEAINLTELSFTRGLTLSFHTLESLDLKPGKTALLVGNKAAFSLRYGSDLPVIGEFTQGKLNDDGETLTLTLNTNTVIQEITFNDQSPWPESADGDGFSLTLTNLAGDSADPTSWTASSSVGGTPGRVEESGNEPKPHPKATMILTREDFEGQAHWILTIESEPSFQLEASEDLLNWRSENTGFVRLGDRLRSEAPIEASTKQQFIRLRLGDG